MPRKGKSNKRNQSRKNKSNKSANKSSKQTNKSNDKSSSKRLGQAFSKELIPILNQLTSVLREVEQLKGNPLYETAIKLDELCDKIIKLQSGTNNNNNKLSSKTLPQIWGFENIKTIDPQIILDRLTLWVKKEQKDSFMGEKFEFKANLLEGRGVIATKDLKEGEHAMSIDRKLMMTYDFAIHKSDEKIRRFLIKDPLCKKVPSLALVLFVWYERMKGSKSYWKPYIDALPTSFGLPHESKIKDLIPFLSGSLILNKIIRLKISHLRHYTYSRQMLSRSGIEPGLRLIDYLWAAGVVMTRQNRIPSQQDNDISEIALIPAWDMCNYKSGKITTYFNTKQQRNEMFIMNKTLKGKQIYIYYGSQRNELLYINSGFVFNDNINDELELDLRLDTKDSLYKVKILQLKNAKLTNPLKCLIPVLNYNKFDNKHIKLDAKIDENEMKQMQKQRQEIQSQFDENIQFDENDISTKWILSVFESFGLSIPPVGIRFARISQMNKDEIMSFMQGVVMKKKQNKDIDEQATGIEENYDEEKDDENGEKVKSIDEIGEPKEVVSIDNEIKAWNVIVKKAKILYDFFTEKLNLCEAVHLDGIDVDDFKYDKGKSGDIDAKKVLGELRKKGKDHVALSFELLDIERNHYGEVIDVLRKGICIVEKRLNRVLNKDGCVSKLVVDETRVVLV